MTRLVLFLSLLLLAPSALAQREPGRISVLAEEFWPYSFSTDSSGQPEGILIEFAIELLESAGMEHELQLLPWPRVMKQLRERDNQLVITLIRTEEREDLVHWIGPVAEVNHALYGVDSNKPRPTTLAELRPLVVATVVDDVASVYLENNGFTNLVRTSDHLKGLEMLTRGRVDLYPGNTALIDFQCAQLPAGCSNIRLEMALTELEQRLYFALSLQTDESTVNVLRERFSELVAAGRLEAIRQSFLNAEQSLESEN